MTPEERRQPQSRKTILWTIAILAASVLLLVTIKILSPQAWESPPPIIVKIIYHPALVLPVWAVVVWLVYRRWKASAPKTN